MPFEARIERSDTELGAICAEFVEQARLVIPLSRLAVVLLQVESLWCKVVFTWRAGKPRNGSPRFTGAVSAAGASDSLDASTMNLPLQHRGQLMGAVLLHSGGTTRYSPQARALARQLADNLAPKISEAVWQQESPDTPHPKAERPVAIGRSTPSELDAVVHPLRSSLTAIKGYVSSLRQPDVTWPPELQEEFLRIIDQEADRLHQLVNDLIYQVQKHQLRDNGEAINRGR